MKEVRRLGLYKKGESRPIKVKFRSENVAKEVLAASCRLCHVSGYSKIFLRRDLNIEEREKLGELLQIAREQNENRSEEDKLNFFWRVKDMQIKKWFIKQAE